MKVKVQQGLERFMRSPYRKRRDVREALRELRQLGQLVLVGGMLRDMALFGNHGVRSDLDFVMVPYKESKFEIYMKTIGAESNRHGGYALPMKNWKIDVWALDKTWAHVNGHVNIRTINDIRKATFFSSDSIAFDLENRRLIYADSYFERIADRILEINLPFNPNPLGNAVRAFRYSILKGFRWGPILSEFISEVISNHGWLELQEYERKSFGTQFIGSLKNDDLANALKLHLAMSRSQLFDPSGYVKWTQLHLPGLRPPEDSKYFSHIMTPLQNQSKRVVAGSHGSDDEPSIWR